MSSQARALLTALTVSTLVVLVIARGRKCLDNKDCLDDECCTQAFYLFRCEKVGYKDGDRCGLCGCRNHLTCVSEGLNPFSVLGGLGVCRHRPTRPVYPSPVAEICSENCGEQEKTSSTTKRPETKGDGSKGSTRRPTRRPITRAPIKPGKDRFVEVFRPIYEQFVELAVSVAGITLDDTTETSNDVKLERRVADNR